MPALDILRILLLANRHQHVKHAPPLAAALQATAAHYLLHPTRLSLRLAPLADTLAPPPNPHRTIAGGRDTVRAHQPHPRPAAENPVDSHSPLRPRLQPESLRMHPPLYKNPEAPRKHRYRCTDHVCKKSCTNTFALMYVNM